MSRFFAIALLLSQSFILSAQTNLSEGAKLLFAYAKTNLTSVEKNNILKKIGFSLSKDKKQFVLVDDSDKEYPFTAQVYPTDLNNDGKEEIFIIFGNSFTSGHTGSSVVLFVKNSSGIYDMNLGFPGTPPDLMPTANKGYPDLMIGGPGFEFPVWRWNGKEYAYLKKIKEQELLKLKTKNLDEVSKTHQSKLKNK